MRLPRLRRDHPLSELTGHARVGALLAGFAVSCGASPEPAPLPTPGPVSSREEHAAPSPTVVPDAPRDPRASIPTIELPAKTACRLEAAPWSFPSLRLSPMGPIYGGTVQAPRARVSVAEDPKHGIVAEAEAGPIVVRGFVAPDELDIYPQKLLMLAGLFVPSGGTALAIVNAAPEKLRVRLAVVPTQLAELREPLEIVATCSDVGLAPSSADLAKALGDPIDKALVVGGAPLSLSPGGSSAITLPATGNHAVNVLERQESDVRIAWSLPSGTIVGWVPKGVVRRLDYAVGIAPGGGRGFGMGEPRMLNARPVRCPHDVPLGVRLDDRKAMIGWVVAGSLLHLFQQANGLVQARAPKAALQLVDGADLFVREPDVRDCTDAK